MPSAGKGSIHLFRVAGIDVFMHWSWFVVAAIEIGVREGRYSSYVWSALEYLALFVIVLLHEFGHAFACRQVGGTANRIMLWPLGGVAFVDPPQRPGAMLWSLAAGPLVNVALAPFLYAAMLAAGALGWQQTIPDAYHLTFWVFWIDVILLVFNLLPVYPLDGGQILRSLLWFVLGRGRSLVAATVMGFVGAAGFVLLALWEHSVWLVIIAAYLLLNCWGGLKHALALIKLERVPRREGFACPSCHSKPPLGAYWRCAQCNSAFDTFATGAVCPFCGARFATTMCLDCQRTSSIEAWAGAQHGVVDGEPAMQSAFSSTDMSKR